MIHYQKGRINSGKGKQEFLFHWTIQSQSNIGHSTFFRVDMVDGNLVLTLCNNIWRILRMRWRILIIAWLGLITTYQQLRKVASIILQFYFLIRVFRMIFSCIMNVTRFFMHQYNQFTGSRVLHWFVLTGGRCHFHVSHGHLVPKQWGSVTQTEEHLHMLLVCCVFLGLGYACWRMWRVLQIIPNFPWQSNCFVGQDIMSSIRESMKHQRIYLSEDQDFLQCWPEWKINKEFFTGRIGVKVCPQIQRHGMHSFQPLQLKQFHLPHPQMPKDYILILRCFHQVPQNQQRIRCWHIVFQIHSRNFQQWWQLMENITWFRTTS